MIKFMHLKEAEHIERSWRECVETLFIGRKSYIIDHPEEIFLADNIQKTIDFFKDDKSEGSYEEKLADQFSNAKDIQKLIFLHAEWIHMMIICKDESAKEADLTRWNLGSINNIAMKGIIDKGRYFSKKDKLIKFVLYMFRELSSRKNLQTVEDYNNFIEGYANQKIEKEENYASSICNALLYIVNNKKYEAIIAKSHKKYIASYYKKYHDGTGTLDEQIFQIRYGFAEEHDIPVEKLDFYHGKIAEWLVEWKKSKVNQKNQNNKRSSVRENGDKKYGAGGVTGGTAKNIILYGPPGTGKTHHTVNFALHIIDPKLDDVDRSHLAKKMFAEYKQSGQIEMVTFHQSFTYEDFIEGIKPILGDEEGDVGYQIEAGLFKEISDRARMNWREQLDSSVQGQKKLKNYVLIIDEINRGNISKIFGELITLIEPSKRLDESDEMTTRLPYSKEEAFGIPPNLHIIGTMNTADRSIALLDTALRRRFDFIEMMPDVSHVEADIEGINGRKLLEIMNDRITVLLDREHQLGHSYLMDIKTMAGLKQAFQKKIIPLLQEYFYENWEKIHLVLNKNAFLSTRDVPDTLFPGGSDFVNNESVIYELADEHDEVWLDESEYQQIYATTSQSDAGEED